MGKRRHALYAWGKHDEARGLYQVEGALAKYKREKREREAEKRAELLRPRRWIDRTHPQD